LGVKNKGPANGNAYDNVNGNDIRNVNLNSNAIGNQNDNGNAIANHNIQSIVDDGH